MNRLGERIKKRREFLKMQLNDLAKKVGISPSALSQIENAKAFPSIVTLKNIADNLHSKVGELIGENETLGKNPLLRFNEKKFVQENESGTSLYLLSHHDHGKLMETYLIEMKKNGDVSGIMSSHPGQEFCHVLYGEVEFTLDNTTFHLEKGDSFYYNSDVPHSALNRKKKVAGMLWIVTPPSI